MIENTKIDLVRDSYAFIDETHFPWKWESIEKDSIILFDIK